MDVLRDEDRQRRLSEGVAAKRAALGLVRPFLRRFEDWNHRAARHVAMISSSLSDPTQKARAVTALKALRAEVAEQFAEFLRVSSTSTHSRVEDVRNAFRRLMEALERNLKQ